MTLTEEQIADLTSDISRHLESHDLFDVPDGAKYHTAANIIATDLMRCVVGPALEAANKRADEAEALVYVPGLWKCAKCDFVLVQSTLNARDGTITPRNEPGDKCPNCASPLLRVSWKSEAADRLATFERCFDQAATLKARVAVLEGALRAARALCDNINEFGVVTDSEILDVAENEIGAALKGASHDAG